MTSSISWLSIPDLLKSKQNAQFKRFHAKLGRDFCIIYTVPRKTNRIAGIRTQDLLNTSQTLLPLSHLTWTPRQRIGRQTMQDLLNTSQILLPLSHLDPWVEEWKTGSTLISNSDWLLRSDWASWTKQCEGHGYNLISWPCSILVAREQVLTQTFHQQTETISHGYLGFSLFLSFLI